MEDTTNPSNEIQSIATSHDSKNRMVELLYNASSKKYTVTKEDHTKEFDEEKEAQGYFDHMVECSQTQY